MLDDSNVARFFDKFPQMASPNMNYRKKYSYLYDYEYESAEEVLEELIKNLKNKKVTIKNREKFNELLRFFFNYDVRCCVAVLFVVLLILIK